jgi:hypothetical protein
MKSGRSLFVNFLQIFFKQRIWVIVEFDEIGFANLPGEGRIEMGRAAVIIAPDQYITELKAR